MSTEAAPEASRCSVIFAQKSSVPTDSSRGVAIYNGHLLQQLFSILGLKLRHAKTLTESLFHDLSRRISGSSVDGFEDSSCHARPDGTTAILVHRDALLDLIFRALHQKHPACGLQMKRLQQADALLQGDQGVIIMLCGTAGTGKSTLASLLGQRLGITTILSTDSIRHMLRGFVPEEQDPVLHASTYESDTAVLKMRPDLSDEPPRRLVKIGYKAQSSVVLARLEGLVAMWHAAGRSAIVEGVHLHLKAVMRLVKQYPSIMPFLLYIRTEEKHVQRMAVRAKYMTTDPAKNKYVRNLRNIRTIQEYLSRTADKVAVPKLSNSNLDVSVEAVHRTVVQVLHRLADGERLLDESGHASILLQEFTTIRAAQKQKQADIKGMHAQVQSLIESAETIRATSGAAGAAVGAPWYATTRTAAHGKHVNGTPAAAAPPCPPLSDRSDPTDGTSVTASGCSTAAPGADDTSHCSSRSCAKAAGDAAQPQVPLRPRLPPPAVLVDQQDAGDVPDSSSESEGHTGHEDTHDDDSDDHMPVPSSNFSVTEIGSLCDSADMDDDSALARLWSALLPAEGLWRDASEPERSTRLCYALVSHMAAQHEDAPPRPPEAARRLPGHPLSGPLRPQRTGTPPQRLPGAPHSLARRSIELPVQRQLGLGSRRMSAPAVPVLSPARSTPGWTSPMSGRSPARPPTPEPQAPACPSDPSCVRYSGLAPAAPPRPCAAEAPAAEPHSADARSMHSTYSQIKANLDTLLLGDLARHPPALSCLRSASLHLVPWHVGANGLIQSRSAHALAAVAEDPSPVPGPPALSEAAAPPPHDPPLRQLTTAELRTLRQRRVLRGLLSWRHQSRWSRRRPLSLLSSGWRGATSHHGSEAGVCRATSPRSCASAEAGDRLPPLVSAHSWGGTATDRGSDDAAPAGRAAILGGGDRNSSDLPRSRLRHREPVHWEHAPVVAVDGRGGRTSPVVSPTRHQVGSVRLRDDDKSSAGGAAAEAQALLHSLLNRVVSHWGLAAGVGAPLE